MKTVKVSAKAKAASVKAKAKASKDKIKEKLKGKAGALLAIVGLSVLLVGCSSAQPASRATSAGYGDFKPAVTVALGKNASSNTVTITIPVTVGDGAIASADSTGSTETQTATPTLDIKPDVNVNYAQGGGITNRGTGGAGSSGIAGIISSLTDEGLAMLRTALADKTTGKVTLQKKDGTTTVADCKDGVCTFEDGTTATCADCEVKQ